MHHGTKVPTADLVTAYREHGWTKCQELTGISKTAITKRLNRYWDSHPEERWVDQRHHVIGGFRDKIDLIELELELKTGASRPVSVSSDDEPAEAEDILNDCAHQVLGGGTNGRRAKRRRSPAR